jgi:hypothetical protein
MLALIHLAGCYRKARTQPSEVPGQSQVRPQPATSNAQITARPTSTLSSRCSVPPKKIVLGSTIDPSIVRIRCQRVDVGCLTAAPSSSLSGRGWFGLTLGLRGWDVNGIVLDSTAGSLALRLGRRLLFPVNGIAFWLWLDRLFEVRRCSLSVDALLNSELL